MEDLVLKVEDSIEENILKIIEYVKQYEMGNGLTEEEVLFKYSYMNSNHLAAVISDIIEKLYGKIRGFGIDKVEYIANGRAWSHSWVKYIDYNNNHKCSYFDIFGVKSTEETNDFIALLMNGGVELHNKFESRACRYALADLWKLRFDHIKIDSGLGPV